jgi:hypothetical protein
MIDHIARDERPGRDRCSLTPTGIDTSRIVGRGRRAGARS